MESSPYLPGPPGSRSKLFAELIVKMGTGMDEFVRTEIL